MSLGLIKALKSLTIKQKNEKLLLIKIFAVGIYADRVVKKEEIDKALDIFHQSFYDEIINHDWEFFRDKLEKKLKNYDAEPQLFLEDEEDIVNWIVKEKERIWRRCCLRYISLTTIWIKKKRESSVNYQT